MSQSMKAANALQNAPLNGAAGAAAANASVAPAQPSGSMFNSFKANVGKLFSQKSKNSLEGISKMRGNTSGQASTSATDAAAALAAAKGLADKVSAKEKEIDELKAKAEEQKAAKDAEAAKAKDAIAAAAAAFAAEQEAREKAEAEAEAKRKEEAAAADAANKAKIDETLAEIKQAKEDLLALARQANVQANAASEMASEAAKKKMANYAQNQANNVNGSATKAIANGLPARLNAAKAPVVLGGRRRPFRKTRRVFRKKHGTKRR